MTSILQWVFTRGMFLHCTKNVICQVIALSLSLSFSLHPAQSHSWGEGCPLVKISFWGVKIKFHGGSPSKNMFKGGSGFLKPTG